ncbi:MAG: hypothetical protein JWQ42_3323 [Edaphobacter sp.]|nr:hypothetical protein [Edaphobacter sp.]
MPLSRRLFAGAKALFLSGLQTGEGVLFVVKGLTGILVCGLKDKSEIGVSPCGGKERAFGRDDGTCGVGGGEGEQTAATGSAGSDGLQRRPIREVHNSYPCEEPLHFPASAVGTQLGAILTPAPVAPVGRDHLDAVFLSERVRVVGLVADEPPRGCAPDRPLTAQLLQPQTVTAGLQTNPHRRSKPGVKLPYRFRT